MKVVAAVFAALAACAAFGAGTTGSKAQPNIVFILVDDLGWADVGFHTGDHGLIQTPHMDKLVQEGVELDRAYAYSWCAPSRSSFLSGRLPVHVMINYTNQMDVHFEDVQTGGAGMAPGFGTMGDKMKEAGYKTLYNGKWGAGFAAAGQMPLERGFDEYLGYLQDSVDYYDGTRKPSAVNTPGGCEVDGFTDPYMVDFWQNEGPANDLLDGTWMDTILIENTLSQIEAHDVSQPLFLIHAFHSVHTPLEPPEAIWEPYAAVNDTTRRNYAAMVTFVDNQVGRIVDAMKAKGMWENTLFVMSSDNGGPIYPGHSAELNGGANNFPLKGSKTVDLEGGIRVVSFVSGPLVPEEMRGQKLEVFTHIADWYATFAALAGVDAVDHKGVEHGVPPVDSINLWPWLSGEKAVDEPVREYLQISAYTLIDAEGYKVITGADVGNIKKPATEYEIDFNFIAPGYGFINDGMKKAALQIGGAAGMDGQSGGIAMPEPFSLYCKGGCLFNILKDPSEMQQLNKREPEMLQVMNNKLAELNKNLWIPDRGESTGGCQALLDNGGIYGSRTNIPDWVWNDKSKKLVNN